MKYWASSKIVSRRLSMLFLIQVDFNASLQSVQVLEAENQEAATTYADGVYAGWASEIFVDPVNPEILKALADEGFGVCAGARPGAEYCIHKLKHVHLYVYVE